MKNKVLSAKKQQKPESREHWEVIGTEPKICRQPCEAILRN
jgi:hypothetical protein